MADPAPTSAALTMADPAPALEPSNPFVHKLVISPLQKLKMLVLGLTLLPIRLVFVILCLSLATLIARIGLYGVTSQQLASAPFTGWRLYIRHAICAILRLMLAVCGFWWVEVLGEQASPDAAPILCVAPHSTFFDCLAVVMMGAPSVVAKDETRHVPAFGSLIRYTQPLLVHRTDPDSRRNTIRTMQERSEAGKGWQQVLIFPEGTCTNRSCLIPFRLGAFIPGVPVQPVIIRYQNNLDTVTWTWEGIEAWRVIAYSLSQFWVHCSIEFLPPYSPSPEEVADPQLFASNVRAVTAERMGVPTTDCSYYDYLRIEKAHQTVKSLRKLQRRLETPLPEVLESLESSSPPFLSLGLPSEAQELGVVRDLCGEEEDVRLLRLAVLMATEEKPYETFLEKSFSLFDPDLGDERMAESSLQRLGQTFLFLPPKEVGEMVAATSVEEGVVSLAKLRVFIPEKRPNYIKAISAWEDGLASTELLAMPASLTAAAEKAQQFMAARCEAGKEVVHDVAATMAASRDKVTDVLASAVTSLHKRTGSRTEPIEKKSD